MRFYIVFINLLATLLHGLPSSHTLTVQGLIGNDTLTARYSGLIPVVDKIDSVAYVHFAYMKAIKNTGKSHYEINFGAGKRFKINDAIIGAALSYDIRQEYYAKNQIHQYTATFDYHLKNLSSFLNIYIPSSKNKSDFKNSKEDTTLQIDAHIEGDKTKISKNIFRNKNVIQALPGIDISLQVKVPLKIDFWMEQQFFYFAKGDLEYRGLKTSGKMFLGENIALSIGFNVNNKTNTIFLNLQGIFNVGEFANCNSTLSKSFYRQVERDIDIITDKKGETEQISTSTSSFLGNVLVVPVDHSPSEGDMVLKEGVNCEKVDGVVFIDKRGQEFTMMPKEQNKSVGAYTLDARTRHMFTKVKNILASDAISKDVSSKLNVVVNDMLKTCQHDLFKNKTAISRYTSLRKCLEQKTVVGVECDHDNFAKVDSFAYALKDNKHESSLTAKKTQTPGLILPVSDSLEVHNHSESDISVTTVLPSKKKVRFNLNQPYICELSQKDHKAKDDGHHLVLELQDVMPAPANLDKQDDSFAPLFLSEHESDSKSEDHDAHSTETAMAVQEPIAEKVYRFISGDIVDLNTLPEYVFPSSKQTGYIEKYLLSVNCYENKGELLPLYFGNYKKILENTKSGDMVVVAANTSLVARNFWSYFGSYNRFIKNFRKVSGALEIDFKEMFSDFAKDLQSKDEEEVDSKELKFFMLLELGSLDRPELPYFFVEYNPDKITMEKFRLRAYVRN